jgi:hypothetical protein
MNWFYFLWNFIPFSKICDPYLQSVPDYGKPGVRLTSILATDLKRSGHSYRFSYVKEVGLQHNLF